MTDPTNRDETWSTAREIEYLDSVTKRHGDLLPERRRMADGTSYFDGIAILESWLATCDQRVWPPDFRVGAARFVAQQNLRKLQRQHQEAAA